MAYVFLQPSLSLVSIEEGVSRWTLLAVEIGSQKGTVVVGDFTQSYR